MGLVEVRAGRHCLNTRAAIGKDAVAHHAAVGLAGQRAGEMGARRGAGIGERNGEMRFPGDFDIIHKVLCRDIGELVGIGKRNVEPDGLVGADERRAIAGLRCR